MPKVPNYKKAIPRIYRRGFLEVTLFSFVQCLKSVFPTISIEDAIKMWYKHFKISEDDYPYNTASQTYFRMREEILYKEKDEEDNKLNS